MLALVAAPLLLRSAFIMGDTIYEVLLRGYGGKRLWLATDIIYNLTTLAIYAGIVAIARHFAKSTGPNGLNPTYDPNYNWNGTGLPPHDPAAKPNMAVHESGPPPLYQQGNFQPAPYNQQGHGNVQYTLPPQHQQYQQPYLNQQQQQPYPNQPQQHQQQQQQYPTNQQQPYQLQGFYTPQSPPPPLPQQQHPQIRSPHSPPPPQQQQQQMSPVPPQQYRPAPSEVSGITSSTGLPSPT